MLLISFILFAVTAFFGVTMDAVRESIGRNPPALLMMIHGLPAAAGLTLLLYATFALGVPTLAIVALILFLIAAGGGALLNFAISNVGNCCRAG